MLKIASLSLFTATASAATATTTRYWDCSGGACGCGWGAGNSPVMCHSNAMFRAPGGNPHGAIFYGSAAISGALGGKGWKGPGCKKCFKVSAQGKTVVLRGTNVCPDEPVCTDRKAHFDIAAPGYDDMRFSRANTCTSREWGEPAL